MLFALARSPGLSAIGVVLSPNTFAPPGDAQILRVPGDHWMSNDPGPHTCSKSGRYAASDSRNAMHAVSGNPISITSTGGNCACSASGLCNRYPVERPSQKLPPKNEACAWLYWSSGNLGE